jgi:drug/metabolite transporter (DMT)-like permease
VFERLSNLIFFAGLVNLVFLPIVFFIDPPQLISSSSIKIIFLIALINVFYQFPYYWALQRTDTSIVTSLFSFGRILTPLLAFLIVGEHLRNQQYIGFFIVILATVLLTFDFRKLKLNNSFFLMLVVSVMLTFQAVLYKYVLTNGITWGTLVFWVAIFDFFIAVPLIFLPKNYRELKSSTLKFKESALLFTLNQLLTWAGEILGIYALLYIPVSVLEGISDTQSIFVLLFALFFASKNPDLFNEYVGSEQIMKKIILFLLIITGSTLLVINGAS